MPTTQRPAGMLMTKLASQRVPGVDAERVLTGPLGIFDTSQADIRMNVDLLLHAAHVTLCDFPASPRCGPAGRPLASGG